MLRKSVGEEQARLKLAAKEKGGERSRHGGTWRQKESGMLRAPGRRSARTGSSPRHEHGMARGMETRAGDSGGLLEGCGDRATA